VRVDEYLLMLTNNEWIWDIFIIAVNWATVLSWFTSFQIHVKYR
jgi:hypothetical protein